MDGKMKKKEKEKKEEKKKKPDLPSRNEQANKN